MSIERRVLVVGSVALFGLSLGCSSSDGQGSDAATTASTVAELPEAAPVTPSDAVAPTQPSTTVPPSTVPATTVAPTTVATTPTTSSALSTTAEAADEPALWSSLDRFLEFYSASSEATAGDTGGAMYSLTLDDVVVGDVDGFAAGFVASEFFEAGLMLGTLNEGGGVTATALLFDPDGESAADALTAFLVSTLGSATSFEFDALLADYQGLVLRSRDGAGEQLWFANTAGTNHSLVVTVVEGAVAGDNLIEVAIVPVEDEESAKAAVHVVRPSLLSLVPLDN